MDINLDTETQIVHLLNRIKWNADYPTLESPKIISAHAQSILNILKEVNEKYDKDMDKAYKETLKITEEIDAKETKTTTAKTFTADLKDLMRSFGTLGGSVDGRD